MSSIAQTLRSWAVRDVVVQPRARSALGVAAFALAITFGAQVAIPLSFTPVPITLQTLFVILGGVVLGPRLGAMAAAAYVLMGAAGAPVFSNGAAGVAWLMGPTGGYLLSAPVAAGIAGAVAGRNGSALRLVGGLVLGVATQYLGGVSQLFLLTGLPLGTVLAQGAYPFVAGDAVKVVVAFWLARGTRRTSFADL